MNQKKLYASLLCAGLAIIGLSFYFYGYEKTWNLWNIPTLLPPFLDLQLLPASAESIRAGYDPAMENPFDPRARIFNYPQIWYLMLRTPINFEWTIPLALVLIALFFISVALFPGKLNKLSTFLLLLVTFSPAIMLGVERANVDIIFFSSLALALVLSQTWLLGAFLALMFGVTFKIYPLLGAGFLFGVEKKRAYRSILTALALTCVYFVFTLKDMLHVFSATHKGDEWSYGWAVIPLLLHNRFGFRHPAVQIVFFVGALLILLAMTALAIHHRPGTLKAPADLRNQQAFWLGAGIYAGTFLLGNNWDYRLIFLLFTIPQLGEWTQQKNGFFATLARITLGALIVSCWYLILVKWLSFFKYGHPLAYLLDESANWILFAGLAYLFVNSLPDWLFADIAQFGKKLRIITQR